MEQKIGCLQATKYPESLSKFAITLPHPQLPFSEHQIHRQVTDSAYVNKKVPVPVDARSKAWICRRSLAGVAVSYPVRIIHLCLVSVVYLQVELAATG
jgi:hypothetical protein